MRLTALATAAAVAAAALSVAPATMAMSVGTAGTTVTVVPSSAPNAFGSPSWNAYVANGLIALEGGLTNFGGSRDTTPTAYQALGSVIDASDLVVTGMPSWRGTLNPAAPFDHELGNRLHFGLHVVSSTLFSLSQISFQLSSSDVDGTYPQGSLAYSGNLAGRDFSKSIVGIYYGPDGVKGGTDDFRYEPGGNVGNDGVLVNEVNYIGVGNGFAAYNAADFADALAYASDVGLTVKGEYTIGNFASAATLVSVPSAVPVPASAVSGLVLAGLLGATKLARSRKATA